MVGIVNLALTVGLSQRFPVLSEMGPRNMRVNNYPWIKAGGGGEKAGGGEPGVGRRLVVGLLYVLPRDDEDTTLQEAPPRGCESILSTPCERSLRRGSGTYVRSLVAMKL